MSTEQDPPRLLDDPSAPPALRAALEEAQAVAPAAATLGAVGGGVARAIRGALVKKALLALVIAGAGLGALVLRPAGGPREDVVQSDSGVAAADSGTAATEAVAAADAGETDAGPDAPDGGAQEDAGAIRTTRPRAPSVDAGPLGVATPPPPSPVRPEEEIVLLERAETALTKDPALALALTQSLEEAYPRGALAQEREAIAIEALAKLGRLEEAQARLRRFVAAHPESPHRMRLERLGGDAVRSGH
jgi:hypothetical protein